MNTKIDRDTFKDSLNYLKDNVDIKHLFSSLGITISNENAKELRGPCKIHGGDNPTSFRFNKEKKSWICFSHRCNEIWGSDIIALIRAVNNVNFIDAVNYLRQLVGDPKDYTIYSLERRRVREMNEFVRIHSSEIKAGSSIVTEKSLAQFKPFRSAYFFKKGYSIETLDHFEIAGGYTDSFKNIRDIIPIRDDMGCLLAFSLRDTVDKKNDPYKYIFTEGFDKDKVLYNLYDAKNHINNKPLIIVEGQKSVWRLYEYGIKNAVAVMGSFLTEGQANLLYKYVVNDIIIFFDNDLAGINNAKKIFEAYKNKLNIIPIFITETDEAGKGLDPSDLNKSEIYSYLEGCF